MSDEKYSWLLEMWKSFKPDNELSEESKAAVRWYMWRLCIPTGAFAGLLGFLLSYAIHASASSTAMTLFATDMAEAAREVGRAQGDAEAALLATDKARERAAKASKEAQIAIGDAKQSSQIAAVAAANAEFSEKNAAVLEDTLQRLATESAQEVLKDEDFRKAVASLLDERLKLLEKGSLKDGDTIALLTSPDDTKGRLNVPVSYFSDKLTNRDGVRYLAIVRENLDPNGKFSTTVTPKTEFKIARRRKRN